MREDTQTRSKYPTQPLQRSQLAIKHERAQLKKGVRRGPESILSDVNGFIVRKNNKQTSKISLEDNGINTTDN